MSLNTKERTLSMLELKPLYKLYMGTLCLNQPNKKLRSVFNLMFGNLCRTLSQIKFVLHVVALTNRSDFVGMAKIKTICLYPNVLIVKKKPRENINKASVNIGVL